MDTSYDAYRMLITTTIGHQLRNQKNCPIYTRIYCPDKSYSLSNHSRIACPVWPVIRNIGDDIAKQDIHLPKGLVHMLCVFSRHGNQVVAMPEKRPELTNVIVGTKGTLEQPESMKFLDPLAIPVIGFGPAGNIFDMSGS